jgi:6-phospho-beta-glucosidase
MKMTLLGSGVRTPYVLHGLAHEKGLGLDEVVLHDVDHDRLEIMSALGAHLCRGWGASFTVRGEPDARIALADAGVVFSAIRVGQERARALDEQIPLKYGVLGQETTGPGGFAMALRTIPVVLGYARLIDEVAPGALVVNFTNPVGIVVQALSDHSSIRVVGVCDGPIEMQRSVARFLGLPYDRVFAEYGGLNHCGWIRRVLVEGRDVLPEVIDRFEDLQRADGSWQLFDPKFVRTIGMLPMEYLYFYYSRQQAVDNIVHSGGSRGEQVERLNAGLWPELRQLVDEGDLDGARDAWQRAMARRDETYFARERGVEVSVDEQDETDSTEAEDDPFEGDGYEGLAIGVMSATVSRTRADLILNVPNRGAIADLEETDVVEVSCVVDEHGAHPLAQGALPEVARALIEPVKAYERLTVRAAVEGSYELALKALLVHPLVGSYEVARSILDDYVAVHGDLLAHIGPAD